MKFQLLVKLKLEFYKNDFSCFQPNNGVFIMLINVKMPTINIYEHGDFHAQLLLC